MSKIYEALIKAREGSESHQTKVKSTALELFKNGRRPPRINFNLEPYMEEQYQKLRRCLLPNSQHSAIKVVMVAATDHGEGGTTTAAILASTLARSKNCKILLVDANLRTPALEDVFEGQKNERGLSDLILSELASEDLIYQTTLPNLFVLPCGKSISSPSYLFDGETITDLLMTLRDRFDFVIFDASPLEAYSESLFLAAKVDGVILVVEAERTKTEVARRIKKNLESAGVNVLGIVLNKKKNYIPAFLERFL
jgi:capsular exopolysaccharide synthesis family protein